MTITANQFDQLQHSLNVAQEEIERLKARMTALEAGSPLPQDQVIQPDACGKAARIPQPPALGAIPQALEPQQPKEETILPDISVGWVGGSRG